MACFHKFLIILLFGLPLCLPAQDLIQQALPQEQNNPEKEIFEKINRANSLLSSKPEETANLLEDALALSFKFQNERGEAYTYHALGALNYQLGKYGQAIRYYEKALVLFLREGEEKPLFNTYRNLGMACEANSQYDQSLGYREKVLAMARSRGDSAVVIETRESIARLYTRKGMPEQALDAYGDLLQTYESGHNQKGIFQTYENFARVELQRGDTTAALSYYNLTNDLASRSQNIQQQAVSNTNIGNVYGYQQKVPTQIAYERRALDFNKRAGNRKEETFSNLRIADLLINSDSVEQALPFLENGQALTRDITNVEEKKEALQQLVEAYEKIGNYEVALANYQQYSDIADSLRQEQFREELGRMKLADALLDKDDRIRLLESERTASSARIVSLEKDQAQQAEGLQRQRMINYVLFGSLFIVMISAFLIWRSSRQRRRANQLLALRSLRSQMNPHFIFNSLNSVNSFIARNDERSANKFLTEFSRLMRAVMDHSHHDFVPLSGEIDILRRYLMLEHFRFQDKFDYTFDVDPELESGELRIPPMLIQPYIENAIWHGLRYKSEKGLLKVEIKKVKSAILAVVQDNGIGRKQSAELKTENQKQNLSTGMKNIETRLNIINELHKTRLKVRIQDLELNGEPAGTRVEIEIPLKNEH